VKTLQLGATTSLMFGHPALPPKRAVGVEKEVAGIRFNGHVVVERIVLAPLEGLEPVDDDLAGWRGRLELPCLKEHAVSAKAGDVVLSGAR
jgi:hypothetical protein